MEQVGWSTAEPTVQCTVRWGSSSSAAHTSESTTDSPACNSRLSGVRYGTASRAMPRVQNEASTTSGSRPPAVQPQAASTIRLAMTALPASYPLECQIVAHHVPGTSSGIQTGRPARSPRSALPPDRSRRTVRAGTLRP